MLTIIEQSRAIIKPNKFRQLCLYLTHTHLIEFAIYLMIVAGMAFLLKNSPTNDLERQFVKTMGTITFIVMCICAMAVLSNMNKDLIEPYEDVFNSLGQAARLNSTLRTMWKKLDPALGTYMLEAALHDLVRDRKKERRSNQGNNAATISDELMKTDAEIFEEVMRRALYARLQWLPETDAKYLLEIEDTAWPEELLPSTMQTYILQVFPDMVLVNPVLFDADIQESVQSGLSKVVQALKLLNLDSDEISAQVEEWLAEVNAAVHQHIHIDLPSIMI